MKLHEYYHEDNEKDFDPNIIPFIKSVEGNDQHEKLEQLEKLTIRLEMVMRRVNRPINLLCCRSNFFGLVYYNVFHSNEQMEMMLEKNFDGRRFTVRSRDREKLDCMFFPFNEEKVMTLMELE